jgi:hypothetical protein
MWGNIIRVGTGVLLCMALTVPAVAGKAKVDRIEDFPSVVGVRFEASFPVHSLMRADCAFVQRTERPDGSAIENMSCTLSDEPVMIPLFQGVPPTKAVVHNEGPCVWISDYLAIASEVIVYAERLHLVVTPSGRVHATSYYPAEPLVCEE